MKRFAALANAGASHQMAMCAIGRELRKRGHQFLLLGTEFQAKQLRLSDIPFQILGRGGKDPVQQYFDLSIQKNFHTAGKWRGPLHGIPWGGKDLRFRLGQALLPCLDVSSDFIASR